MMEENLLSATHVCWYSVSFVYIGIDMRYDIRQSLGFGVLYATGCVKLDVGSKFLRAVIV